MKKRQLIAPTVLSLILCGLLTDSLYFRQSPWSAVNLIGKILSVILTIALSLLAPVLGLSGNIAQSLERMRLSLRAVTARLEKS